MLTFTEKQDISVLLTSEIDRIKKQVRRLPKKTKNMQVLDRLISCKNLIKRYETALNKINAMP